MAELDLSPRATARPALRRSRTNRVVTGVAGGLAQHLGMDALLVRILFVGLTLAGGFGLVVYLLLLVLAPLEPLGAVGVAPAPRRQLPRLSFRELLGGVLLIAGILSVLAMTGFWFDEWFVWPIALAGIGFAILWARNTPTSGPSAGGSADTVAVAGEEGRGRLDLAAIGSPVETLFRQPASPGRTIVGALLILAGGGVFLAATTSLAAAANVILAVIVTAIGLGLLGGPYLWRMANDLMDERAGRIRSQARAEMAAHLHDSVLQTLALIQRSKDSREMVSLARTQERDLRAWLYGRAPSVHGVRLRDAIDGLAGRVERSHRLKVEAVVVGDAELDDDLRALVAATNEAVLNAAKHAEVEEVDVYVEVEAERVTAFIRDAGTGFDPAAVPADRRGIADSIVQRMARHGGTAEIRTKPGAGTEIRLNLPRVTAAGVVAARVAAPGVVASTPTGSEP